MKLTREEARSMGIDTSKKLGFGRKKKIAPNALGYDGNRGGSEAFDAMCQAHGLPKPVHEVEWHPTRKWRADWIFDGLVMVEQVGGVWIRGHHSRGQQQIDDMERRNEAQIVGYIVLEFTPQQLENGEAFPIIKRALDSAES